MPKRVGTAQQPRRKMRSKRSSSSGTGEWVREEIHQIGKGKGAPKSRAQAIAIGLSRARKAGVPVASRGRPSMKKKRQA